MNDPIIIGAGIAGLSAANYLADHGIKSIIIEAGIIGRKKVCGEFFSYEAIPFLKKWEIPFIPISNANFISLHNNLHFQFPQPSVSVSRSICEIKLAERAKNLGTKILENISVKNIFNAKKINQQHKIQLSNDEILETDKLIIASGRLPFLKNNHNNIAKYLGIKTHLNNVTIPNELFMFMIPGAYLGVTYIDNATINVCCLAKKNLINKFGSHEGFMQYFINNFDFLKKLWKNSQMQFSWLTASVNNFGKKENPRWHNTYFIGDAAATIHPASGNGLTMGLTSGIMAAEHITKNNKSNFKKQWNIKFNRRLKYAKALNFLFMNKTCNTFGFKIANFFPNLTNIFYRKTRE